MAGNAEPMPPRIAVSLRGPPTIAVSLEVTLHYSVTRWTRGGVLFWKENRSDGELYHVKVSNPDLLPRRTIPHTVG